MKIEHFTRLPVSLSSGPLTPEVRTLTKIVSVLEDFRSFKVRLIGRPKDDIITLHVLIEDSWLGVLGLGAWFDV